MAVKLRKWSAYRKVERPYTRWSKSRKKAFVKSRPGKKVIKFDMGDIKGGHDQFPLHLTLITKDTAQMRTNSIEACRITGLKRLERELGRSGFYLRIRAVPHQMIRENPLAAGAGADRLSTGMKHSFGKVIGTACQVHEGKIIFDLFMKKENELLGRDTLKRMSKKLTIRTYIQASFRKAVKLTAAQILAKARRDARIDKTAAVADAKAAEVDAKKTEEVKA
jgi:large subunit ribosomal protein L10e